MSYNTKPQNKEVYTDELPSKFPFRKNITYALKLNDEDVIMNSLGGYVIGDQGCKIKEFVLPINNEHKAEGLKQFMRIRGLGKFHHSKNKSELYKRMGENRFEMCFNIYNQDQLKSVVGISKDFEKKVLYDLMKYSEFIKKEKKSGDYQIDNSNKQAINKQIEQKYYLEQDTIEKQIMNRDLIMPTKFITITEKYSEGIPEDYNVKQANQENQTWQKHLVQKTYKTKKAFQENQNLVNMQPKSMLNVYNKPFQPINTSKPQQINQYQQYKICG